VSFQTPEQSFAVSGVTEVFADLAGGGGDLCEQIVDFLSLFCKFLEGFRGMTAVSGIDDDAFKSVQFLLERFSEEWREVTCGLADGFCQVLQHFAFGIPSGRCEHARGDVGFLLQGFEVDQPSER